MSITYPSLGIILPLLLLLTTGAAFSFFKKFLPPKTAYFFGFAFYWLVWCLLIPFLLMTSYDVKSILQSHFSLFIQNKVINITCLVIPLLFAYLYVFPKAVRTATLVIILISLLLAIVNASLEEFLWRGLYLKLFASDKDLYIFISSSGFAIWHFAPQLIFPNKAPGGKISFVAFAFVLGILFSVVAFNTKSIVYVVPCHILFDFSGLGARLYFTKEE